MYTAGDSEGTDRPAQDWVEDKVNPQSRAAGVWQASKPELHIQMICRFKLETLPIIMV